MSAITLLLTLGCVAGDGLSLSDPRDVLERSEFDPLPFVTEQDAKPGLPAIQLVSQLDDAAAPKTKEMPPESGVKTAGYLEPDAIEETDAEKKGGPGPVDFSTVDIEGLRKRLDGAELEEEARKAISDQLGAVEGRLARLIEVRRMAAKDEEKLLNLPDRVAAFPKQVEEFATKSIEQPPKDATAPELEQLIAEANVILSEARQRQQKLIKEVAERNGKLKSLREKLAGLDEQRAALPSTNESELTGLAGEIDDLGRRLQVALFDAEATQMRQEERYLAALASTELPKLWQEDAGNRIAAAEDRLGSLQKALDRLRRAEINKAAREAREVANSVPKVLQPTAAINETLIAELQDLGRRTDEFRREEARVQGERNKFEKIQTRHKPLLDEQELSELHGLRLRDDLLRLPDSSALQQERQRNLKLSRDLQLRQFEIEADLQDVELSEGMASAMVADNPELAPHQTRLAELLKARRDLLQKLKDNYEASETLVYSTYREEGELVDAVCGFRSKAEAAVLWVRSNPSLFESEWTLSRRALSLFRLSNYTERLRLLVADFRTTPLTYCLATAALMVLLVIRTRAWKAVQPALNLANRRGNTSLQPYLLILLATAVMAALWPVIIGFVGYRFAASGHDQTSYDIGLAIVRLSLLFFTMEFIRKACRESGFGEVLGLPEVVTRYVRRKVLWMEWAGLPLMAVIVILHESGVGRGTQLAERLCFVAGMAVLTAFFHKLLRSRSPLVNWSQNSEGLLGRYRPLFYLVATGLPVLLAGLSVFGYHFAALRLAEKLQTTLWIGLGILVARLLLTQLVQLHRRRMAVSAMHERAEQAAVQQAANGGPVTPAPDAAPATDIGEMSEQLRRLIGTLLTVTLLAGVYMTWVDVLPSLERVANFTIYEVAGSADGELGTPNVRAIGPIDLVLALLVGVIAFTASRNLPGLLEFTLLNRMGLDRSVRYAVTTICSYIIATFGLLLAGKVAGFAWQNVQWLAAGLTVGLGFGLQEIFANFISGLIIFIEQPVRVGDVVTLSEVTGTITRIRIRATTITNWDRKEYIVPNREFITGRLLNWTLTDQTNRIVVEVGVAYGSDVAKVRSIIQGAANAHPEVMDDPAPNVTFEAFGDSSLNFVLRCYLPSLENRLSAIHELHDMINTRFHAEGIEIPFPQRDLNVRHLPADQLAEITAPQPKLSDVA